MIVGDTGNVVPAEDPQALAQAWEALLTAGPAARRLMGNAARKRVEQNFDLGSIVERYQELYRKVLASTNAAAPQQSSIASFVG
jgi:glycosyltransferase involved in cell wall biosynthesis